MAIYIDDIGAGELPLEINNPQDGESLIWSEELGAYVNAPAGGGASTEQIQDTVADMLEVDPDGTQVALRLVSSYDDVTGKITFNVVSEAGGGAGGNGTIIIKEGGTTRGVATTLDFVGPAISFTGGVATISGMMESINIQNAGTNVGNVQGFNFEGFELVVNGDTVTVVAPQGTGGGSTTLNGLTDVVITGATTGQVLKYNGTNWINDTDETGSTINSLGDIGDVNLSGISSGQILGWNGTTWVPTTNSGEKGDKGDTGNTGPAGVSVASATVNGSGNLILTLSNSTTINAGSTVGPKGDKGDTGNTGATGSTGPAGATITSASVSISGRLLVSLSTGQTVDAGSVAGISSATVNGSGDLILTKQDSTTINAGSVIGPKGDQGIQGATGNTGAKGDTGATGVGFNAAAVNGSGDLIITKTDSTTINAGSVIGPRGLQGATGATGATGAKGDTGVSVNNAIVDGAGDLHIYTDDGADFNAGSVIGPQGPQGDKGDVGEYITSASVNGSGKLIIVTSDANSIDAGSVIGPKGDTGLQGAKGDKGDTGSTGATGATGPAFSLNSVTSSVNVYGIGATTQPGYDLEVDTANKWRTARSLTLSGKITGLATGIDGSGNITLSTSISPSFTTTDLTEGTQLYHTTARARSSVSSNTLTGISYNSTTGVFSLASIPNSALTSSTITVNGTSITLGGSGTLTTSNISEGTGLYFTNTRADARADVRIAASSINALADVDTATTLPTSGQALVWDGTVWKPGTVAGGGGGGISTVNGYSTSTVTLVTDDIAEDGSPSNKWFTDARARASISAGGNLSYNSTTGVMSYTTPSTTDVSEGTNLYYTTARFDTRLGQSNLAQLNDVADTTATSGQVLAWNSSTSKWTPTTGAGGGGTTLQRLAVQVDYDASGNLSSVTVLNGDGSASITAAASSTAEVEFTLTGFSAPPISAAVYGYQRVANTYTMRHVDNATWTTKKFAAGGSAGSPTLWSGWDPTVHKFTLTLTKAVTLASAGVGQTTHCVVQITGM